MGSGWPHYQLSGSGVRLTWYQLAEVRVLRRSQDRSLWSRLCKRFRAAIIGHRFPPWAALSADKLRLCGCSSPRSGMTLTFAIWH